MMLRRFVSGVRRPFQELAESDTPAEARPARITMLAKEIKYELQAVIAIGIIVIAVIGAIEDGIYMSLSSNFLLYVGEILAFSAAVDLAYMLFTPGPDEAIDPVIIAVSAAILILVSVLKKYIGISKLDVEVTQAPEFHNLLPLVLIIVMLVFAIALLFYIRQKFRHE
jgi:hypothetical protein